MNTKRLISLITVLTLLASALLPVSLHAHSCAGSEAVARSLERNDHHHHDDAVADEHDHHAGGHHDHGDHHGAGEKTSVGSRLAGHADEMSYCCHDGGSPDRHTPDGATLPSRLVLVHALTLLHAVAPSLLPQLPEQAQGVFKIGASPPFLASTAHSTYLRISVLLI